MAFSGQSFAAVPFSSLEDIVLRSLNLTFHFSSVASMNVLKLKRTRNVNLKITGTADFFVYAGIALVIDPYAESNLISFESKASMNAKGYLIGEEWTESIAEQDQWDKKG